MLSLHLKYAYYLTKYELFNHFISYISYGNVYARVAVVAYSIFAISATTPCYPNGFEKLMV